MTNDPIDEVIQAYLDYLERGTPEPSLDHLGPEDRQLAEDIINSMNAGRGINPYHSRPSYVVLTADTGLTTDTAPPANVGLTLDAISAEVADVLDTIPIADGAAENEGILSHAVTRCGAHRIRFQFRDDLTSVLDVGSIDPQVAAGPVFGRFPETAIVVVVIGDAVLSSVAMDMYDTEPFIGSPDGEIHPPRLSRPILPLRDTLRLLAGEFTTISDTDDAVPVHQAVEVADIAYEESQAACAAIAAEGRRARTDAKKDAWSDIDASEWLKGLTLTAATDGLTEDDLEARLTVEAAAA